ncbi:unnamed protein product, partial [Iphiclides podalirius]
MRSVCDRNSNTRRATSSGGDGSTRGSAARSLQQNSRAIGNVRSLCGSASRAPRTRVAACANETKDPLSGRPNPKQSRRHLGWRKGTRRSGTATAPQRARFRVSPIAVGDDRATEERTLIDWLVLVMCSDTDVGRDASIYKDRES